MVVSAESAGKLLLFGEHAALYGHPAVGMSLPWSTRVTIHEDHAASGWGLPFLAEEERSRLWDLVLLMFELFPSLHRKGYSLMIESNIPRGMGFGSSAALCVALVKAVLMILEERVLAGSRPWYLDRLWALANRAERLFHGRASGIDTGLSILGEMRGFQFDAGARELPAQREVLAGELILVVGAVPRDGDTKRHVARLAERLDRGDPAARNSITELGGIAREALSVLGASGKEGACISCENLAESIGELANRANSEIEALGLGNDTLRRLLALGRDAGASGGKVSGAGGGGAFYLAARDMDTARAVHARLSDSMRESGLGAQPLVIVRRADKRTRIVDLSDHSGEGIPPA